MEKVSFSIRGCRWPQFLSPHTRRNPTHRLPRARGFGSILRKESRSAIFFMEGMGVFAGMILCYVAFLIFSTHQQIYSPWELRYHAYFMYEVDSWSIVAADLVAVVVCLMLITGLSHNSKHHHLWLWYSCLPGTLLAVFWLHHMLRLTEFRWDVLWLPLGPLGGIGICLYVDHLLKQSSEEIRKLRGYMYAYKAY